MAGCITVSSGKFRDTIAELISDGDSRMAIDHSPRRELVFVTNRATNCVISNEGDTVRALGFATVMSTRFVMDGELVASVVLLAFSQGKLLNEIGRKELMFQALCARIARDYNVCI